MTVAEWVRTHPRESVVRTLGVLFNAGVGALFAGLVAYGPLHADTTGVIVLAAAGATIYGALWFGQQRMAGSGRKQVARTWRRWLIVLPILFVLIVVTLSTLQLYRVGQIMMPTQDRVAGFERLWNAMNTAYPYFDTKGIDWMTVHDRYRPQVEATETDDEYYTVIAQMLSSLDDGHTYLARPFPQRRYNFAEVIQTRDGVIVTTVSPAAREAGLRVGDVVLAVDGQPIDDAIVDLPPQLRFGSTERSRRDWALANLFSVWGTDETLDLTVETASAGSTFETRTLMLPAPVDDQVDEPADARLVTGKRLPSGIGLIRLPDTFQSRPEHDIVTEFDAALDELMDTPGLIIDLRANGGGNSSLAEEMAGRLLAQPVIHGREYYRSRLPTRAWWSWSERDVTPRPPIYTGPVVLLVDATNVSTAEEFIVALVDSGRARTVGRRTGGSVGNPLSVELPGGGLVRFSSGEFRRMDGTPVEEVGIAPQVAVEWTIADVRAGRDPDLAAAEALILNAEREDSGRVKGKIDD